MPDLFAVFLRRKITVIMYVFFIYIYIFFFFYLQHAPLHIVSLHA